MSGMITVLKKELADDFTSWRFLILFAIALLLTAVAILGAAENIRGEVTGNSKFVFLALFTTSGTTLPFSFLTLVSLLVPVVGIALGFDAINSEKSNGTMSRLLSQPIYRDAVINGKFLASIITIAIMLTSVVMLVAGIGLRMIGVPPNSEEVIRLGSFLVMSIIYGGFWLGLAILFSVFFRRIATSALSSVAVWIVLWIFIGMLAGVIANGLVPVDQSSTLEEMVRNAEINIAVSRISPYVLFSEAMIVLLVPGMRTMGQLIQIQTSPASAPMLTPLSLGQSLLMVWPHLVGLIALTVVCFAISYVKFMREEIRST